MANEIYLRLGRGEYVGGDTIYGSVYLRIQQQVSSSTLKLVIRGFQSCKYGYQYIEHQGEEGEGEGGVEGEREEFTPHYGQRTMIKDIIKHEVVIGEGLFPVGCYIYPFMYQLPHNIPGSFSVQHETMDSSTSCEGVVQYSVTAVLTVPAATNNRLSAESRVVVYNSLECRNSEVLPQPQTASGSVRTFFCITRGSVRVTCKLQQSAYYPSSRIVVSLDIKNDSAVDVAGYTVNLLRVIKLQALDRMRDEEKMSTHTVLSTILESEGQGSPKNNTTSHEVVLNLSSVHSRELVDVPPNTSSSLVKCSYVIDVNVHVPWGPDIELRHPLLIKAADNEEWKTWTPPSWIHQCVKAHTAGPAAVADDALSSSFFAGIPGLRPEI